jgi:Na+-transporting methylmalonyl-CoA/oxaloacetate decarboxylase gamma subunit
MSTLFIINQVAEHATAKEFVELDPYGIGMAILAMLVVILVLAFAATIFQNIDNLIHLVTKITSKKKQDVVAVEKKTSTSGEEAAAIALALHLYISNQHDSESMRLTLNRISKTYSPWSSKIYGVMNSLTSSNINLKK